MDFQENENNIQELLNIFQAESEEILERIFENLLIFEKDPSNKEIVSSLYRDLHSIKGALRMVGFNNLQNVIHRIEDIFDKLKNQNVILSNEHFITITRAIEFVSHDLASSVDNQQEIVNHDINYSSLRKNLQYRFRRKF